MSVTRRTFLATATAAATSASLVSAQPKKIPLGLELYSVRSALSANPMGTVKKVAAMGYQVVEFFSPYYAWTTDQAKEMKKLLDDLGIQCRSTHNNMMPSFLPANLQKTIDLNHALGTTFVVMASSNVQSTNPDDWKKLALETLVPAHEKFRTAGLRGGYHNHQAEFVSTNGGPRPMEVIAANTPKDFMLQFDVGTCLEKGGDPVAWVNANPGRINSMHLKDWNKERGYRVLFGEGAAPWKPLLAAAERTGGVEYFLIEQEGSDYSEFETAQRCLANYRKMFG
jgi:sugar phosphate isomerase/epimerase